MTSPTAMATYISAHFGVTEVAKHWAVDKFIHLLSKYISDSCRNGDVVQTEIRDALITDLIKIQNSLGHLCQAKLKEAVIELRTGLEWYEMGKKELAKKELNSARRNAQEAYGTVTTMPDKIEACKVAIVAALWEMDDDPEAAAVPCMTMLGLLNSDKQTWNVFCTDKGNGLWAMLTGQVMCEKRKDWIGRICSLNIATYCYLAERGVKVGNGSTSHGLHLPWPAILSPDDPSIFIQPLSYCLSLYDVRKCTDAPASSCATLQHVIPCFRDEYPGLVLCIWMEQKHSMLYHLLQDPSKGQNLTLNVQADLVAVNNDAILVFECLSCKVQAFERDSLEGALYKYKGSPDKDFFFATPVSRGSCVKFLYKDGVVNKVDLNDADGTPQKIVMQTPDWCPTFDTFQADMDYDFVYHNMTGTYEIKEGASLKIKQPKNDVRGFYVYNTDTGGLSKFITSKALKAAQFSQMCCGAEDYMGVLCCSSQQKGSMVEVYEKSTWDRAIQYVYEDDECNFQGRTIFKMAQSGRLLAVLSGHQLNLWEMSTRQLLSTAKDVSLGGPAWPTSLTWIAQSFIVMGFSNGDLCKFRVLG